MSRRLKIICLLFAWCCANGLALDLAQCVAWAKMFVAYAPAMPVATALVATFDPAKPCALCLNISQARKAAEKTQPPAETAAKQLLWATADNVVMLTPPRPESWARVAGQTPPSRVDSVPTRPPRSAA